MMLPRALRVVALASLGFLLATFSISAYSGSSFSKTLFGYAGVLVPKNDGRSLALAACVPNTENEEIFFISCGGIY
jgi:hypothetical protein